MGKSYKHDEQISVNMLSLMFALVKSKKSESFGIENDDLYFCPFNLYIKSIRCYCSPFYIKASLFSMIFIFTESVTYFLTNF